MFCNWLMNKYVYRGGGGGGGGGVGQDHVSYKMLTRHFNLHWFRIGINAPSPIASCELPEVSF